MSVEIKVPALGESVSSATVARWMKQAGAAVAADEPLVELETDKVTVEVPAPAAGVLEAIVAKDGAEVEVGALLGTIAEGAAAAAKPHHLCVDASSGMVMSGPASTVPARKASYASSRLSPGGWPRRAGAAVPGRRTRCISLIANDAPTPKWRAAARGDRPASTNAIARSRKSDE